MVETGWKLILRKYRVKPRTDDLAQLCTYLGEWVPAYWLLATKKVKPSVPATWMAENLAEKPPWWSGNPTGNDSSWSSVGRLVGWAGMESHCYAPMSATRSLSLSLSLSSARGAPISPTINWTKREDRVEREAEEGWVYSAWKKRRKRDDCNYPFVFATRASVVSFLDHPSSSPLPFPFPPLESPAHWFLFLFRARRL